MLKSYAFDIDSNLIFTDTTLWIDTLENGRREPKEISQQDWDVFSSEIKKWEKMRYLNNDQRQTMKNFYNSWTYEKVVFDSIQQNKLWPSWDKFLEAHKYASPLAYITARGHPLYDFKNTHKKIIYEVLTASQREDLIYSMKERLWNYQRDDDVLIDAYLNNNFYAPCSNEPFLQEIQKTLVDPLADRKNIAFEQFVLHVKKIFKSYYGANFLENRKIRIGFSDDNHLNIKWLHHYINDKDTWLMRKYPEIKFVLYNTNKPEQTIKSIYTHIDEV